MSCFTRQEFGLHFWSLSTSIGIGEYFFPLAQITWVGNRLRVILGVKAELRGRKRCEALLAGGKVNTTSPQFFSLISTKMVNTKWEKRQSILPKS